MKKLSLLIALLLTQCSTPVQTSNEPSTEPITDGIYTIFSLNVHDFPYIGQSAETVSHVIDLHEKYQVPVDIYVDDQVFQMYVSDYYPDLVERLKSSPVVTVGYHLRVPTPYYFDYKKEDYMDIASLSDEELYATLLRYEEYKLDLETGDTLDAPGGYQFVKDTIGYAPPVVSTMVLNDRVEKTLSKIYEEKGATFDVVHNQASELGDEKNGLYIRPETIDYKLYEKADELPDGAAAFEDAISLLPQTGMRFIGMKYHENNFYNIGTPFWPIYYKDIRRTQPLLPPFDLSAPEGVIEDRTDDEEAQQWAFYESTVKYAAEHAEEVHPVSVSDLEELM